MARVPALGAGCRRFKSCHLDHKIKAFGIFRTSLKISQIPLLRQKLSTVEIFSDAFCDLKCFFTAVIVAVNCSTKYIELLLAFLNLRKLLFFELAYNITVCIQCYTYIRMSENL